MSQFSPAHAALLVSGARMFEVDGWQAPADFGDWEAEYAALRGAAALLDLSLRGKLRVTGPDRVTFLHNMLTNDVRALRPGEGCNAAKLSIQGRMEAGLHVLCFEDALRCDIDPGPAAAVQSSLVRHLVMEDAAVDDVTADWALFALQGPAAADVLARCADSPVPELAAPLQHATVIIAGAPADVVRADHCGENGFDLWVPAPGAEVLWQALRGAGARPCGFSALDARRIEAGIPWAGHEIDGEHFPMEAGLDAGWISATKGCYLGQETISRLRHLGHVNRTLRGLVLPSSSSVPARGSAVFQDGTRIGVVTSAAHSPYRGRAVALAYLRRDHGAPGSEVTLHRDTAESEGVAPPIGTATVTALPFV